MADSILGTIFFDRYRCNTIANEMRFVAIREKTSEKAMLFKLVLKTSKSAVFSLVRQVIKYPNRLQVQVGLGYVRLTVKFNILSIVY